MRGNEKLLLFGFYSFPGFAAEFVLDVDVVFPTASS
jgi:hypothetical protein